MSEFVYSMYRADKFYGPDRQVLANISLSFFHGAKIGVLGPNGAGKSTLLRIMAGREETSSGTAQLAPGATVGLLEQEPELDPAKDVRGNVEDGVRELRDLLDRFNAISAAFAEPDADYDTLLADQAKVQDEIDRRDAWSLDATLDRAMDALRLPDGDRDVTSLSGGERRRVALCRLLLHLRLIGEQRVEVGVGLRESRRDGLEAIEQIAQLADAVLDVAAHVLPGIELRLLFEEADGCAWRELRRAARGLLTARHDPQQRRLAGAVRPEHTDLRAVEERERDVRQHLALRPVELVGPKHREDVLVHAGTLVPGGCRTELRVIGDAVQHFC